LKFVKLGPVFAALVLAACQSAPPDPVAPPPPPAASTIRGVDLAIDSSTLVNEIKHARLNFVARYYRDPASRWPALSPREIQSLSTLDTNIVTVWEYHSGKVQYFTYATGYYEALSAYRQAKSLGQPEGSAIYFAVDFNAREQDLYWVDQYFRGVRAGLSTAGNGRPEYKIGVYGSGAVCTLIKGEHLAEYSWLSGSTAWEGTSSYAAWNIKQAPLGMRYPSLSFDHDVNEAREDYGGFRFAADGRPPMVTADVAPAPEAAAPQPAPQAAPVQAAPDSSLMGVLKSLF
jgi:hypothetical protein